MFDIKNSADLYKKLLADSDDLHQDPSSARHAINCILTAYHLHEWVWADWLKKDHVTQSKLGIRNKASFSNWLEKNVPGFIEAQALANGSKHFGVDRNATAVDTKKIQGAFAANAFYSNAFHTTTLKVEINRRGNKVWIDALEFVDELLKFWGNFLQSYSPYRGEPAAGPKT
jgi:hypothetical protein